MTVTLMRRLMIMSFAATSLGFILWVIGRFNQLDGITTLGLLLGTGGLFFCAGVCAVSLLRKP